VRGQPLFDRRQYNDGPSVRVPRPRSTPAWRAGPRLKRYQAQVDRWDSEVKRLRREVLAGVVDPQVLLESENQWKASRAKRKADLPGAMRRPPGT
jgi:hypothetical protein